MLQEPTETREVPAAPAPHPNVFAALWRIMRRVERDKIQPWIAARNAIGVSIPLAAAVAAGSPESGLVVTTGALNVSFTDGTDPYLPRAQRMVAASLLSGFAVAAGALCGHHDVLALGVPVAWAAGAGLMVALDAPAADIGLISLVTLVVFAAHPMSPDRAILAGLLAMGGGLLQTLLSLAAWPIHRYEPERRVLGALYKELGRAAASPVMATSAPAASSQATDAQRLLSGLSRSRTVQGVRYLSLLNQAERLRVGLVLIARIRTRLRRQPDTENEARVLDECLEAVSKVLTSIGESVETGVPAAADPAWIASVHGTADRLRTAGRPPHHHMTEALLEDARHQLDALAGQLRAAIDLSASSTMAGRAAFERRQTRERWQLRLQGTFAILRANLSPRSAAFQHAVRLSFCVGIGELLSRALSVGRAYWVPMTIAIVLKPDFASTFSRGVLRVAGTFAGLVLATGVFHVIAPGQWTEVLLISLLVFAMRCFGPSNYGILVTLLSAYIVILFALGGTSPGQVIAERGWNTVLGGGLALGVYALWPTWERSRVSGTLADLLDAYRAYFRAVREAYVNPDRAFERQLNHARTEARLARSNLEASVDRYAAEPGVQAEAMQSLNAMMASSHRLVHAIMALDAGLSRSRPAAPRPAFINFANHVELTLHSLAAALRGSRLRHGHLPDLRQDHEALIHSGDSLAERYALVNIETDRITNSLNTLSGQVIEWVRRHRSAS